MTGSFRRRIYSNIWEIAGTITAVYYSSSESVSGVRTFGEASVPNIKVKHFVSDSAYWCLHCFATRSAGCPRIYHIQGAYELSDDFIKPYFLQILNRNTWCYYHLKEECLQFHSDLKCIRCAPHVWHGRCPGDTPIPAEPFQACLVWRSRLRCWCAVAILVVSLEVVGRKHFPWRNPHR